MPDSENSNDKIPIFNGGKMAHLFAFDETAHLYTRKVASESALEKGRLYYKVDGSNGLVQSSPDGQDLEAFQRLDTRGRPPPENCRELPAGQNVDSYQGHSYYYEQIRPDVNGKNARKRNDAMLRVVQTHSDNFRSLFQSSGGKYVSIEWVGRKFNKTPGVNHDVAIAIHSEQVCDEAVNRNYDDIRSFLLESDPPIEGLILEHEGIYWKVRSDCFDKSCRFKTETASARPPVFLAPID
jgi:hypothetical protein